MGQPFLRLTCLSSTSWVAQFFDVMFVILFIINTSKVLTSILHIVIMASFIKIEAKSTSKGEFRKIMTIKTWLRILDKCSRSRRSCLHVSFISWKEDFKHYNIIPCFTMWSNYCYDILNMTRMLILGFMHRFGFELMYGDQKLGILTVFWATTDFRLGFINDKYWII